MALLLMHATPPFTICHSKTRICRSRAARDIIVAAMAKRASCRADWIKLAWQRGPARRQCWPTVFDVGTNRYYASKKTERLFQNFPDRLEKFRAKAAPFVVTST